MIVVCTRYFLDIDIELLKEKIDNVEFIVPEYFDDESLISICEFGVDIFLGPPPSEVVLNSVVGKVKFIQIPWSGIENIDFSVCEKNEIPCYNSHSNSSAVAELAIGLMFSLLKKTSFHHDELKIGKWHRPGDDAGFYPPVLLQGLTVGYYGFGSINFNIHKMLNGFELRHKACVNKFRKIENIDVYPTEDISNFISNCDIIFIGAPLTNKTINAFDDKVISAMKKKSYIINMSRAKIVNEPALVRGLSTRLGGAAMDVWYSYPGRGESRSSPCSEELLNCHNLVLSPHRAGYVENALPHLVDVVSNLISARDGNQLKNRINFKETY